MCEFRNSTWETRYARLHDAADEMYELLKAFAFSIHGDDMFGLMQNAQALLERIDGKEDNNNE